MSDIEKEIDDIDNFSNDDFDFEDDRKVDISTIQKIKAGAKANIKQRSVADEAIKLAKASFPSVVGDAASRTISDTYDEVSKEMSGFKKEIRDSSKDIIEFAESRVKSGGFLDRALKKTKKFLGEDVKIRESEESKNEKRIRRAIEETVGTKNKIDLANLELNKRLAISTTKQGNASISISSKQLGLAEYSTALQERYYRKSIELKYRQLFEQKVTNKLSKENAAKTEALLSSITKNTSLPDAVKIKSIEVMKLQSQQKLSSKMYDYIGMNKLADNPIARNFKRKVGEFKNNALGALSSADMAASMSGMMDQDMIDMLPPEERAAMSNAGKVGSFGAGSVIDKIKNKTLGKALNKFSQTKVGSAIRDTMDKVFTDPNKFFSKLENNTSSNVLRRVYGFGKDMSADDDRSGGASITRASGDLSEIANFDIRTYNSLNTSIPSLLSKILREVTVISTGDTSTEELVYDSNKGTLISKNRASSALSSDITRLHGDGKHRQLLMQISKLEKLSGVSLSPKERKQLLYSLLEHNTALNSDYIDDEIEDGLFSNLPVATAMKFTSLIKNASNTKVMDGKGGIKIDNNRRHKTNQSLSGIHEANVNMVPRIENMIKDGMGEDLRKAGFVSYDKSTETYRIIDSKIRKTNADILLSKINTGGKQSTNKFGPVQGPSLSAYSEKKYVEIDMPAMKSRVSDMFDKFPKKDIESNIDKITDLSPEVKKEIKSFVNRNYKRTNDVFSSLSKSMKKSSNKKEANQETVFDVKYKGKNFFDKIAIAVEKNNKPIKKKYDKDGDGDRDGSWKDIFDAKKLNKRGNTSKLIEDISRGKSPKGGIMGAIMPILGMVTSGISLAMAPLSALKGIGTSLLSLPLLLTGVGNLTGLLTKGLYKLIKSTVMGGARIVSAIGMMASGGLSLGKKGKNLFRGAKNLLSKKRVMAALIGGGLVASNSDMFDDMPDIDDLLDDSNNSRPADNNATPNSDGTNYTNMALGAGAAGIGAKLMHDKIRKKSLKDASSKAKDTAKIAEKSVKGFTMGKVLGKAVPGLNIAFGVDTITDDIGRGDYGKAALHTLSTALSIIPLIGVPLSMAADYAIDVANEPKSKSPGYKGNYADSMYGKRPNDTNVNSMYGKRPNDTNVNSMYGKRPTIKEESKRIAKSEVSKEQPYSVKSLMHDDNDHLSKGERLLLEEISAHESQRGDAGYDIVHSSYKGHMSKSLTQMTLSEVSDLQKQMVNSGAKSGAVGKYQFIDITFDEVRRKLKLKSTTLFDKETQDMMILSRITYKRGFGIWKKGQINDAQFLDNLSMEFASIPNSKNSSLYAGRNGNKILTSADKMLAVLSKVRQLLKIPKNTSMQTKTKENQAKAHKPSSLVSGITSAIKSLMEFFGGDDTKFTDGDGDSSTNKPDASNKVDDAPQRTYSKPTGVTGEFKFCGIPIKQLPAIKTAVDKAGNKKFANGVPKHLIIHNTDGNSIQFGRMKRTGYGTQLWIDRDGTVYLVGDIDQVVYHIGNNRKNRSVKSSNSLGIEMVSKYNHTTKAWGAYTPKQARALQAVAACIRKSFNITPDRIFYHEEISPKTLHEGREGAIIAKSGSLPMPEEVGISTPIVNTGTTASGMTPSPMSVNPSGDGDSSTNKPLSSTSQSTNPTHSSPTNKAIVVSKQNQPDALSEQIAESNQKVAKLGLEHLGNIEDILSKILQANVDMLNQKGITPTEVETEKRVGIDETPAIDLSS